MLTSVPNQSPRGPEWRARRVARRDRSNRSRGCFSEGASSPRSTVASDMHLLVPRPASRHKVVMEDVADTVASSGRWSMPPPLAILRGVGQTLLDAVLPPRCAACRMITASDAGFCVDCWQKLDFMIGPACARCDLPFEQPQGDGALCGACMADPPPYSRVHVPIAYGEISRSIVMRLKYGRRTGFARLMARMMMRSLTAAHDGASGSMPLLVPVPLHRWRIWSRGFNQSALIARELAKLTGWPVAVDGLRRRRRTPPLRGLGRAARARTVRGAFAVAPDQGAALADRRVILVDDVFTTGATAAACARALLRAGASTVEVAAFARVIHRPEAISWSPADIDSGLVRPDIS